ncbi:hypothetical protein I307_04705 [Cryptococcus deuterogattii 99/473]|uniref:Major facilitator superfamily (MFS) profile domain-containing protein n=1 Tax=Cryptococcus deuterogattii Ram5 TaxID=1296110 RepID=A0A0D0T867_9TREE|nr:hypothetical protein I309_03429 [Cryptococcus deuterogattii LA55]KIR42142.1 hypothetical protein I313_02310 [Cryptococcus deuterogattii Ram5]KIR73033.1 hypothetical protein I310_02691 [Cryptococcus deuterogattii CA1014]KIR90190.1 hypothetical protein I304_06128 [Cryptococcus deuterogattii CBS 10090]KIY56037.1 hypothetical protein I307_04705 [Cryptococcus deuterogattii 99/473]
MTGKHSNVHTQEPPLPIPPYLRTSSRRHSDSSVSSQHSTHQSHQMQPPHPQQHEFVPTFDSEGLTGTALYERALFEDAVSCSSTPNANSRSSSRGSPFSASFFEENPMAFLKRNHDTSAGANFEHDLERTPIGTPTEASLLNWEAAREGSISRRPKWRRPSPKWVYPVIMGMALSLGMGSPPRSELYVNLACMAHPPTARQKTVMSALTIIEEHDRTLRSKESEWVSTHDGDVGMHNNRGVVFIPVDPYPEQGIIDSNIVDTPHTNTTRRTDLSPADKWFIHLQHEIYEYRHKHSPHAGWSTEPGKGPAESGPDQSVGNGSDWNTGDGKCEDKGEDHSNGEERRTGGPFREIDPQLCKRDAKVQAAAAKLTMMLTLTMGFLSALTTGFWGSTSDKWGRTKIMTVVEVGLFLNELCFILVANFPHLAPGGYRSLLIGPTIEGLLGGFSTITATVNAYLSDITPDGSRVMAFSRAMGFMMAGFACGPVLGSILIQSTGDIMTPFYINLVLYSLSIPLVLFLLPESLSSDARLILAKRARLAEDADARREAAEIEWEDETPVLPRVGMNERVEHAQEEEDPLVSGRSLRFDGMNGHLKRRKMKETIKRLGKKATGFLAPLGIFLPKIVEEDEKEDEDGEVRVSGRVRREWNMTVMGMVIIKYVKSRLNPSRGRPISAAHEAEAGGSAFTTSDHSLPPQPMSSHNSVYDRPSSSPPVIDSTHTGHLDLFTIRLCLFLELVPWFILSFGTSESAFIILTALTTFGSPATPAANSLALSLLPDPSQSGRLFGALSVVHALGATLISPLMFGMLFASTVEDYAAAVFALAAAFVGGALVCMLCVRIPESGSGSFGKGKNTKHRDWENDVDEFEREEGIGGRGRNRKVKRVMSMSVGGSASSLRSSYDGEAGVSSAARGI